MACVFPGKNCHCCPITNAAALRSAPLDCTTRVTLTRDAHAPFHCAGRCRSHDAHARTPHRTGRRHNSPTSGRECNSGLGLVGAAQQRRLSFGIDSAPTGSSPAVAFIKLLRPASSGGLDPLAEKALARLESAVVGTAQAHEAAH
eukprot:3769853-Prymnesium_polylepis.2